MRTETSTLKVEESAWRASRLGDLSRHERAPDRRTTGMARVAAVLAALALLAAPGCGPSDSPPEGTAPSSTVQETAPETEPAANESTGAIRATVKVVDLEGQPLANMAPIVTRQPNAFDEPLATGSATRADGTGTIRFTPAELVYLRAWDPALNYFPNNFYEVHPGGTAIEDDLVIQMVPAARLEAQFFLPSGEPAANERVGIMLIHASRGPWWPAEVTTSSEGAAAFPNLPAGEFVLHFKAASGPRLEYEETALPPGSTVNLGALSLQ